MSEVKVKRAQVYRAPDGWRWRSLGGNGEVIAQGESYKRRGDAVAACHASVPENVTLEVEGLRDVEEA